MKKSFVTRLVLGLFLLGGLSLPSAEAQYESYRMYSSLKLLSVGDGQVTVDWQSEPNATVTSYEITVYDSSYLPKNYSYNAQTTTATITGLTNGMTYSLYLYAKNGTEMTSRGQVWFTPYPAWVLSASRDSASHVYTHQIRNLLLSRIAQGYDDGTFRPDVLMNRAEFSKIVTTALSLPLSNGRNCFNDVHEEWFAPYVCSLKEKGVLSGYNDGSFRPEQTVSYAEALKIALKAANIYPDSLKAGEEWSAPFLKYAIDNNLNLEYDPVSYANLNLKPLSNTPLKRGQMAVIILWLRNLPDYIVQTWGDTYDIGHFLRNANTDSSSPEAIVQKATSALYAESVKTANINGTLSLTGADYADYQAQLTFNVLYDGVITEEMKVGVKSSLNVVFDGRTVSIVGEMVVYKDKLYFKLESVAFTDSSMTNQDMAEEMASYVEPYLHTWWYVQLPMSISDMYLSSGGQGAELTEMQKEQLQKLLREVMFYTNIESLGTDNVQNTSTNRFQLKLNPDAILAYTMEVNKILRTPLSNSTKVELQKIFRYLQVKAEMWTGLADNLPYKYTGTASYADYWDMAFSYFFSFNQPVNIVVPTDAKDITTMF